MTSSSAASARAQGEPGWTTSRLVALPAATSKRSPFQRSHTATPVLGIMFCTAATTSDSTEPCDAPAAMASTAWSSARS
jgi:hypothetical protein